MINSKDFKNYPWLTEDEVNQLDLPVTEDDITNIGGIIENGETIDYEWEDLNNTAREIILDVAEKLTKLRFMGITDFTYGWIDEFRSMHTSVSVDFEI